MVIAGDWTFVTSFQQDFFHTFEKQQIIEIHNIMEILQISPARMVFLSRLAVLRQ